MVENERFLVTDASGPIGAWVVKHLLDSGVHVVALLEDDRRLRLIAASEQLTQLRRIRVEPGEVEKVTRAVADATHVVHTQRTSEDDALRDRVGAVASTVGAFVAVLSAAEDGRDRGIAFESSMSVFGPSTAHVDESTTPRPSSLRGCLHLANEVIADRWFREAGVSTLGLRPSLIYGPGHDMGRGGEVTRAIAAAVDGQPSQLSDTGPADFQFVSDVALAFITAARASLDRHRMLNLNGHRSTFSDFAQALAASTGTDELSLGSDPYPVPIAGDQLAQSDGKICHLPTSLDQGIRATLETFRWSPRDLYRHGD